MSHSSLKKINKPLTAAWVASPVVVKLDISISLSQIQLKTSVKQSFVTVANTSRHLLLALYKTQFCFK